MESVGIFRALWRRRIWVALGAAIAIAIGLLALYRVALAPPALQARTTSSGFAFQRVLVDTPSSLLADAKAKGAAAIGSKAVLLGGLMGGDEARSTMARKVGVRPAQIGVIGPGTLLPAVVTPLAVQAIEVTRPLQPYVVTVSEDPGLPILSIFATAPNQGGAAKLVEGTTAALAAEASRFSGAEGDANIEPLGKATVGSKVEGVAKMKALIVIVLIGLIWCVGVVVLDGLARRRLAT